jgi:hypothetical protein
MIMLRRTLLMLSTKSKSLTDISTQQQKKITKSNNHDIYFFINNNNKWKPSYNVRLIIRIGIVMWFCTFVVSILMVRYHYTSDVLVAIIITLFVTSNINLFRPMVRWLYRPNYNNYKYKQWWQPVYLNTPLNAEQLNYETKIKRISIGGYL